MLNINEDDLKAAIVEKATEEILRQDDDLSELISKEVNSRLDKIFNHRASAQIEAAINDAIKNSFDREYQKITQWGEPTGPKTTIRAELEKTVSGYWSAKVEAKNGRPTSSDYNSVTRAEYLMTQVCAQDFSEGMKSAVISVTGALKDGLRNHLAAQMDNMLSELFHVRSLQDQGKVEKPY
jgi:hypothetical protein